MEQSCPANDCWLRFWAAAHFVRPQDAAQVDKNGVPLSRKLFDRRSDCPKIVGAFR